MYIYIYIYIYIYNIYIYIQYIYMYTIYIYIYMYISKKKQRGLPSGRPFSPVSPDVDLPNIPIDWDPAGSQRFEASPLCRGGVSGAESAGSPALRDSLGALGSGGKHLQKMMPSHLDDPKLTFIHIYIYIHYLIYTYTFIYFYLFIYLFVYLFVYIYIYNYIYIIIYIYNYIYIPPNWWSIVMIIYTPKLTLGHKNLRHPATSYDLKLILRSWCRTGQPGWCRAARAPKTK